jgi:hypothetical protein
VTELPAKLWKAPRAASKVCPKKRGRPISHSAFLFITLSLLYQGIIST